MILGTETPDEAEVHRAWELQVRGMHGRGMRHSRPHQRADLAGR